MKVDGKELTIFLACIAYKHEEISKARTREITGLSFDEIDKYIEQRVGKKKNDSELEKEIYRLEEENNNLKVKINIIKNKIMGCF